MLLKDHGDAPLFRGQIDPVGAAEQAVAIKQYLAAVRLHQSRQHAYQSRFTAAGHSEDTDPVATDSEVGCQAETAEALRDVHGELHVSPS